MSGLKTRKLLTAAVGVATVSYVVGCGRTATSSDGNDGRQLGADPSTDEVGGPVTSGDDTRFDPGGPTVISGNLVAPPPVNPRPNDSAIISGNLVAPPPIATEVEVTQTPDSSFIAGNLLPPPSNWQVSTEPPVVTEAPETEGPVTTDPPVLTGGSDTRSLASTDVEATLPPSATTGPQAVTELPDAQAPLPDASVIDGEPSL